MPHHGFYSVRVWGGYNIYHKTTANNRLVMNKTGGQDMKAISETVSRLGIS
jgi:hypothetical protein